MAPVTGEFIGADLGGWRRMCPWLFLYSDEVVEAMLPREWVTEEIMKGLYITYERVRPAQDVGGKV